MDRVRAQVLGRACLPVQVLVSASSYMTWW